MSDRPLTLGTLIELLEQRPLDQGISFDFCGMVPMPVQSYRGYYDHLAIGCREPKYGEAEQTLGTVGKLLADLREAIGKSFEGYKGGEFVMDLDTPIWVANYGNSGGTAVVNVGATEYWTYLLTAHCEEWSGSTLRAMQVLYHGLGFGNTHLKRKVEESSHA